MTGNAVPVFTGKKPGPKILTAWAEQERQDAKAAAKEAEYWGNVGAIEIDLDTLDLTPKPALSPDHPGYEARERENAKLVDLADWRENARGRSIYQNSTEYEERERQIAEDCEWRALTEKLVIVYDDGDEPFEDTTARDMLPEIRRELELLNQPEIVAERNAHIRVTNKTGKMVHEEIGIDGKVVRKTCDVGGIRHEISVEKCIDDLAAFDHYTREDGIDSDLIEAVIAPLLDMACEHVKGDVQDAFRAACDAYTAELAAPKQRKATAKTGLPAELRVVDAYLRKIDGPVSTHNLKSGLRGLIKRNHLEGDEQAQNRLVEGLAAHEHIALGKVPARQMVARAVREVIAENKPKRKQDSIAIVNEWSDPDMADWSQNNLASATDLNGDPRVYDYEGDVCDMHNRQRRMLSEKQFAAINNNVNKYAREKQDGERRGEFAPKPVIDHNFHRSDKPYPELKEVKSAPFFTNDGRRVGDHGYDEPAKTYLDLGGLEVPPVSDVPSDEDTTKAKELFFEMIGDFPFDGVADREECEARFLRNEGAPLPSAAHAVCLILERAARDLINGPTPVYAPTKPKPGTGAGALVGAITLAATGCKAAAESMPATDEEYTKVMSANISESGEYVFFDNMNAALTLGTFASNVTEGRVRARLLGSSRMIEAEVRLTWVAAANNIKGTPEILRRLVMIELDSKLAHPEDRDPKDFRHPDLPAWVEQHRPELVWAILTLIQNWVALGMHPWAGKPKASFVSWSRVMGGILRDAGIRGFLENEERLRSYGATGGDSGVEVFMQHLAANYPPGTLFRAGGTSPIRGREDETVVSLQAELNVADDGKPLLLDGWGYNREDQQFNHARGIKDKFREAARGAYEVTLHEMRPGEDGEMKEVPVPYAVSFKEEPDPKSPSQYYWELVVTEVEG